MRLFTKNFEFNKITKRNILLRYFFLMSSVFLSLLYSGEQRYSISLYEDSTYNKAVEYKNSLPKDKIEGSYIVHRNAKVYNVVYGIFLSSEDAKKFRSTFSKEERISTLYYDIVNFDSSSIVNATRKQESPKENVPSKASIRVPAKESVLSKQDTLIIETKKQTNIDTNFSKKEIKSADLAQKINYTVHVEAKQEEPPRLMVESLDFKNIDGIAIDIDTLHNHLSVSSIFDGHKIHIKNYIVSSARAGANRPLGQGGVSMITLNPSWYPTEETIEYFREKKGIDLPTVVLPKSKYNYMGAAKINLTHSVDGRNVYRIHGTINEKSIGTKETSGCIRMKNNEVIELAAMLKKFVRIKNISKIQVFIQ